MNIYVLRHGETNGNKEKRVQGRLDVPLNEKGIQLAEITRDGLKKDGISFDKIYSSPLSRARQTAQIVRAGEDIPLIFDNRLLEMDFGAAEGMAFQDIYEKPEHQNMRYCFSTPSKYTAENGAESFEEILARAKDFLMKELLPLEGTCENILVAAHGALIRAMLLTVYQWDLDKYWTIYQPNCCLNLLTLKDGKFEVAFKEKIYYDADIRAKGVL